MKHHLWISALTFRLFCYQGYYDSEQTRFVSGKEEEYDVDVFEAFLDANASAAYRLAWPYSNPNYTEQWEIFENKSFLAKYTTTEGNARCTINLAWLDNVPE